MACSSGGLAFGVLSLTPRWMTSSVLRRKSMKLHRGLTRNPYTSSSPGTRATPNSSTISSGGRPVASAGQVADPDQARLAELAQDVLLQLVEDDALHRPGSYSGEGRIAPSDRLGSPRAHRPRDQAGLPPLRGRFAPLGGSRRPPGARRRRRRRRAAPPLRLPRTGGSGRWRGRR